VGDFAAYYVCLTLVIQLTMSWNADEFEAEVRQGKLSPKLLRPFHPLHYAVVENIVFKVTTLPVLVPALILMALAALRARPACGGSALRAAEGAHPALRRRLQPPHQRDDSAHQSLHGRRRRAVQALVTSSCSSRSSIAPTS
jgi:hypothetical protein